MTGPGREEIVAERLDAVRRLIDERGAPAALLRTRRNFAWVTFGGESHVMLAAEQGVAGVLVTPSDAIVLTAVNEAPRIADEELVDLPFEVRALPWHDEAGIDEAARRIAGGGPLDDAGLEPELVLLRCILAAPEAERLGWLAGRILAAAGAALDMVSPGVTEHQVAAVAVGRLASEGVRAPVVLAAADDRIDRYRHPLPTKRQVARRLMIVLVAERWGLHAAVTRFAELAPPTAELQARKEAVERIHAAMVDATRPGATLGQVLSAGMAAYAAEGHPDEWQLHHQGGIIGYQGRERIAVPDDPTVVRAGMAFSWNPSITGAKAEETILLGADGMRDLTATSPSSERAIGSTG